MNGMENVAAVESFLTALKSSADFAWEILSRAKVTETIPLEDGDVFLRMKLPAPFNKMHLTAILAGKTRIQKAMAVCRVKGFTVSLEVPSSGA